jgi:Flp pilus assembly pilin Flp
MNIFKSFKKSCEGVAAIEFALVAPLLCILLLGTIEVSNFVYADIKTRSALTTLTSIFDQQEQLISSDIKTITEIVPKILEPITITAAEYVVIITSIQQNKPEEANGVPKVNFPYVFWQETHGNASLLTSDFTYNKGAGDEANRVSATALRDFTFSDGDQIIFVEIAMKYNPLTTGGYAPKTLSLLSHKFFSRPRKGSYAMRPDELE